MAGDHGLSNLRFDGYDNSGLVDQVNGLRNGPGPETLNNAVVALVKLADGLSDTDEALRRQLADIGVTWQGEAASGGTQATQDASIYAEQAQVPVTDSAKGVDSQGAAFSTTKNKAPDSGTLNGPTEENGVDQFLGFFGHTTDHAQQVKDTNAARQQAIDAMNSYQQNSIDSLNRSQALPVPPGMSLNAQPVNTGTHTSSVGSFVGDGGGGFTPGGTGGGGGSGANFVPGGGGGPGGGPLPPPGGNPLPVPGNPPLTGGGPLPGNPSLPSGVNPLNPAIRAVNPLLMADAATAIGAGGASAGGGADGERVSRTGGQRGPLKNGTPVGSAPAEEARAARNAERFGARAGKPGSSIMQPAAAGRNQEGEEDQEHVRRYGVESSDVFDDDRVVAPESIGDDDDQ
jgi:PPE family